MYEDKLRYLKKRMLRVALCPLRLLPVKRKRVLLINGLSGTYSGNPKYVAEYLARHCPELEILFAVKDVSQALPTGIKAVKKDSPAYFCCAMTAQALLTNSGGLSYIPLRKRQFVINTHHGGGAYKKAGVSMYVDSSTFRKNLLLSANQTDRFLSTNRRFTEVLSRDCLLPREVFWEIGMPRNDILIQGDRQIRERVRNKLGLADGEKLVLYAPTYRKPQDNYFRESIAPDYGIDAPRVCRALERRFGGTWRMAMRLHPCVVNRDGVIPEGVMDLTDYPEMQELLLAADVMINDFSSSMWDFMLTGKPCFTFALDLQHYVETTEVYTPVSEWPFPQSVNNDELERSILAFDEEEYKAACERHYRDLGGCESGEATRLVCEKIREVCGGTERT